MEDVILSYPEECDCYRQWHLYQVWRETTGKRSQYTVADGDGDHTPISYKEVMRLTRNLRKMWREYAAWVAENGTDPLNEYMVPKFHVKKERWTFLYRKQKDGGISFYQAWRTAENKPVLRGFLPTRIQEFGDVGDYGWDEFVALIKSNRPPCVISRSPALSSGKMAVTASVPVKIPNKRYGEQLKAAAAKAAKEGY